MRGGGEGGRDKGKDNLFILHVLLILHTRLHPSRPLLQLKAIGTLLLPVVPPSKLPSWDAPDSASPLPPPHGLSPWLWARKELVRMRGNGGGRGERGERGEGRECTREKWGAGGGAESGRESLRGEGGFSHSTCPSHALSEPSLPAERNVQLAACRRERECQHGVCIA